MTLELWEALVASGAVALGTNVIVGVIIKSIFQKRNDSLTTLNLNVHKQFDADIKERKRDREEMAEMRKELKLLRGEIKDLKIIIVDYTEAQKTIIARDEARERKIGAIMNEKV